ncbi:MAG: hypothetical protein IRY85_09045 [Micromonosporaceae bacterium]|nr:hypothetical protein [Micromonosporaceae bacterium]
MMLAGTVTAIHATADLLGEAERRLPAVDPGATAFGARGLGLLGEVGQDAYRHWQAAMNARVREARAHAARVRDLADLVDHAAGGFHEAQQSAGQAHRDLASGEPGVA